MQSVAQKIERYRRLAEELRTAMEDMATSDARATFRRMADAYELLADRLERREKATKKDAS